MPVLTYFPTRGLAEVVRIALAAAGVPYEQRFVGDADPGLFPALKASGVLTFGSVPYWEEGPLHLVQSDAILRHVARTHGLYGSTAVEAARCDELHEGTRDVRTQLARLRSAQPSDVAALRVELNETVVPRWLGHFERRLGDRSWFVGEALTYADLSIWALLELLRDNDLAGGLGACPALCAFEARVAAVPGVARHLSDPKRFPVQPLPR